MSFTRFGEAERIKPPPNRPTQLVLVQAKDTEGFWNNVHEGITVKRAILLAELYRHEEGVETRVVTGPKREVVRVFKGRATGTVGPQTLPRRFEREAGSDDE